MIKVMYFLTAFLFLLYFANVLVGAYDIDIIHLDGFGEFILLFAASILLSIVCLLFEKRHHDLKQP